MNPRTEQRLEESKDARCSGRVEGGVIEQRALKAKKDTNGGHDLRALPTTPPGHHHYHFKIEIKNRLHTEDMNLGVTETTPQTWKSESARWHRVVSKLAAMGGTRQRKKSP